ncbi:MAG: SPOR domain-containing protein [Rhodoferax sp.]|nr:SPOR domain-containing protein [Rhodoferax sp.]MDP3654423.1 SPOR domain-containing protein [Rhodoferax sp.]
MKQQRGGTILGFIIGVVVGLAGALAVAVYVTKVPVPFINKGQSRSAEQDAAEAVKNKDWDPNAALYGKNPAKVTPPAAPANEEPAAKPAPDTKPDVKADAKPDAKAVPKADAKTDVKPDAKGEVKPAVSADPLGDLAKAKAKAAPAEADAFSYFVQVGAFNNQEDAESHRAKLSLSGIETKISEREQSGKTVYRVRVGPFDKKEDAERAKEKLDKAGMETALVRVQR